MRAAGSALATTIACPEPEFPVGGPAVQTGAELRFSPPVSVPRVAVYFGVSALASVSRRGGRCGRLPANVDGDGGAMMCAAVLGCSAAHCRAGNTR